MSTLLPEGTFPACLTPLNKDLSVNYQKLVRHSQKMLEDGSDGIVLMGTTGEANSFDQEERKSMLEAVVKEGIDPDIILVGTGCCSLTETVSLTRHALEKGVSNVLVMPPFYYRNISSEGLFSYYEEFIHRVNNPRLRIYFYHFPKMSGVPVTHEVIEKLIENHGQLIAGIKDSSGDFDNMVTLCARFPNFKVYSGNEVFLKDLVEKGGAGTISATLNVSAKLAAEVYQNIDNLKSEELQEKLTALRRSFEKYPFIPILKLVLSQMEKDEDWLNIRPPLTPLRLWNEDEVKEMIESLEAIA